MTSATRTIKNAFMLFSGTALRMVATFAFIFYAANVLGPEKFGRYSIVVHYFELFVSLTASAAAILLTRDAARWKRQIDQLFTSAVIVVSTLALLAPLLILPVGYCFGYSNETIWGLAIACLGLIPAGLAVLYEALFVATERAEFVTAGVAVESTVRVCIGLAVLLLGFGILELSLVLVFSRSALALTYFLMFRHVHQLRWSMTRRSLRRFTLRWRVFAAENWMALMYTSLDVIVLSWLSGEAAAGLYSAAWRYVRLGAVVAKSFTTAVFPTLSRLYVQSRESFYAVFQHAFRALCIIALPPIAVVSVMPTRVVNLIYSQEYSQTASILQILIWMLLLEFINPFLSHVLFSQGKQRYSMYVAAIGLSVNIVLMFWLVNQYGPMGAAWACVLSGLTAAFSYLYFSSEMNLAKTILFETSRTLAAGAIMAACIFGVADQPWWFIGLVCIASYPLLLLAVGAIRLRDLQLMSQQFFSRAVA